jgi:hypothetical protein
MKLNEVVGGVICRDDIAGISFAFASPLTSLSNPLCIEAGALLEK